MFDTVLVMVFCAIAGLIMLIVGMVMVLEKKSIIGLLILVAGAVLTFTAGVLMNQVSTAALAAL